MSEIDSNFYYTSFLKHVYLDELGENDLVKMDLRFRSLTDKEEIINRFGLTPASNGLHFYAKKKDILAIRNSEGIIHSKVKKFYFDRVGGDGRLYTLDKKTGEYEEAEIRDEDLPDSFIELFNFRKMGWIQTAGIKDLKYVPSDSNSCAFSDDHVLISYDKKIPEDANFMSVDYYIFGYDIVRFVLAAERNSPRSPARKVKKELLDRHNRYIDEMQLAFPNTEFTRISKLEELEHTTTTWTH